LLTSNQALCCLYALKISLMAKRILISVVGPTASGKTGFAVYLASRLNGEIISGDSRQVYRGMDIGTGKDIVEYSHEGTKIPYHLIDIADPGEKYNVYRFQADFIDAYKTIVANQHQPILCGGSGMYVEAVLKAYNLLSVPPDHAFRKEAESRSMEDLTKELQSFKSLHNNTDIENRKRVIRAIEIERYYTENAEEKLEYPDFEPVVFGVDIHRDKRRKRITDRLKARLEEGMVDEIRSLLDSGVSADDLIYYGLEYKYVTLHAIGKLTFDEMQEQLNIAIHQFAKRQMTWFRGMERRGTKIHWIDYELSMEQRFEEVEKVLKSNGLYEALIT